ncbi:MAG TPA: prephenate dehydratase domain-containing protein, partial [Opitutales bacterium]|nr:prephenate dehydratase domain-containing protein [Opitutales bacterium]
MDLDSLRKQIDAVDLEIIERLNARVRLASEVGQAKQKQGAHTYVPSREEIVFERLIAANPGPLTPAALKSIYREIISVSIGLQKELAIAYLGPEATFTHQAALKNFGSSLRFQPCATIPDVFTAVERGEADHGVVPIENSTEGAVFHSLDMLVETELKIVAQVFLPIEHCLISAET